jgi:hypothetical protein
MGNQGLRGHGAGVYIRSAARPWRSRPREGGNVRGYRGRNHDSEGRPPKDVGERRPSGGGAVEG